MKRSNSRFLAPIFLGLFFLLFVTGCDSDLDYNDAKDKGILYLYGVAFVAGFLTSLTPCVYPMIPITMSLFGAKGESVSRGKAFLLAFAYVLGMAALFTPLGVGFALAGQKTGFGQLLGEWYVVLPLCLMFLAFALSLFGLFEMKLPYGLQQKLNNVGGAGYKGAFGMGLVGGLIAAPCVGPFALSMLTAIATKGGQAEGAELLSVAIEGGLAMFFYALGIGVIFMALALFSMSVPRSGQWMEWIKSFFGIMILVMIFYYLRPLFPALEDLVQNSIPFRLGAIALALVGVAIGSIHLSFHGTSNAIKLRKALGVALGVVGGAGLFLSFYKAPPPPKVDKNAELVWVKKGNSQERMTEALELAKKSNKGVMIDFWASWCAPCKKLDITMVDPEVYPALGSNFIAVKIDMTDPSDIDNLVQTKYKGGLPTLVFLDSAGTERARITKPVTPTEMRKVVEQAASAEPGKK